MSRPMRSWMFVPGNKARFLEKAAESDVDCVLLDVEDGVLPEDKPAARKMVSDALRTEPFRPLRFVRVNAVGTPWHAEDLDTVVGRGLAGICLPKVESPEDVTGIISRLEDAERQHGLEPGSLRIVAAIESAAALLRAPAIAVSHPRLVGLMFGAEDFALDLGLGTNREGEAAELVYARSSIVVAAAAARILSIDGVYPNLEDPEGMVRDIVQARRLGFTSKSTFNPRQVEEINRVFSPQSDEIAYAKRVVEAFALAKERGEASVAVGGQLVDRPIVLRAQRLLELVEAG